MTQLAPAREQSQPAGLQEVSPPGQHVPLWQTATKARCLSVRDQTWQEVPELGATHCTQSSLVHTVLGRVSLSIQDPRFIKASPVASGPGLFYLAHLCSPFFSSSPLLSSLFQFFQTVLLAFYG